MRQIQAGGEFFPKIYLTGGDIGIKQIYLCLLLKIEYRILSSLFIFLDCLSLEFNLNQIKNAFLVFKK